MSIVKWSTRKKGFGVLHDVLRQPEVVDAEDARQRGDHAPRLVPEEMIAGLHYVFICWTGRTSTEPPTSRIGQPLEISTACARSLASIELWPEVGDGLTG